MLLLVALLEVVINRVAVPMLRPTSAAPPSWHTYLDYFGLFLFYFAGTLAVLLLASRSWQAAVCARDHRDRVAAGVIGLATVIAAAPLVVAPHATLALALEIAFAASVLAVVVTALGKHRDVGLQVGIVIVAIPLWMHVVNALGAKFLWPDNTFDGPSVALARAGLTGLCLVALASPYCFAPRPFARAVLRPLPLIVAIAVAVIGAALARTGYAELARAATLAFGVELTTAQPDPRLAMYLLAVATLAWTLVSCARAASPARRTVGSGLALIVLAGAAFKWPHHYLLPLLGLVLIGEAARTVRDEELAAMPVTSETPPIGDTTWSAYIAQLAQGLGRVAGAIHSLNTRDEGGLASSLIIGDAAGLPMRVRIERIDGCVLALDVVLGREIDETRGATLTVWAIPSREVGPNPPGPAAAPAFKTGDAPFDERFKTRGSALAFQVLFDDGLRARAVATLDGWLAYWQDEGLRYRVYPGRGAPVDHPMPLSDLALSSTAVTAERLITVIELLIELASRGIAPRPPSDDSPEPSELV